MVRCKHGFFGFPCPKIKEVYDLKGNCLFEDPTTCANYEKYDESEKHEKK